MDTVIARRRPAVRLTGSTCAAAARAAARFCPRSSAVRPRLTLEAAVGKRWRSSACSGLSSPTTARSSHRESLERSCPPRGPLQSLLLRRASPSRRGCERTTSSCGSSCPSGAAYHSTIWRRTWRLSCPSSQPRSRGPSMAFMPRCGRSWPPTATTAPRLPRWASRRLYGEPLPLGVEANRARLRGGGSG